MSEHKAFTLTRRTDGRWQASVSLGTLPNGKRNRPSITFEKTMSEEEAAKAAQAWADELTRDGARREVIFGRALEMYLDTSESNNTLSTQTIRAYRSDLENRIPASLKSKRVKDVDSFVIQQWLDWMQGDRALSHSSASRSFAFVSGACRYLVKNDMIAANPCKDVIAPQRDKHEAMALDESDYVALDEVISSQLDFGSEDFEFGKKTAYAFADWLALHTGMRVGEVCAVRRRDVHMNQKTITCNGTIVTENGRLIRQEKTKGKKSRTIDITEDDIKVIRAYVDAQNRACGHLASDAPLVSIDGSYIRPDAVSVAFTRLRKAQGIRDGITFHSLRHTHATWLLLDGMAVQIVSLRLGHSSVRTTIEYYAHVMPGGQAWAAEQFATITRRAKEDVL